MLLNISPKQLFPNRINLFFKPDVKYCTCGNTLQLYKTKTRRIVTLLQGACNAHITQLYCNICKKIYYPEDLRLIVPSNSRFSFDIIVYIGTEQFMNHRSDEEIQRALHENEISISLREINYLGKKFIVYLALAHHECQDKIKKHMESNGGYILHLDGTCEGDSPHLFSFIDELSRIVLGNIKIPSENSNQIKPSLEEIKTVYGNPIAVVHDMSSAVINAVEFVFPDMKKFICHLHFLRDIGKDLFGIEYNHIRRYLKSLRARNVLRKLVREFKIYIDNDKNLKNCLDNCMKHNFLENTNDSLMPPVAFYLLTTWVLESKNKSHGYGFPFDRPHVDFCDRLRVAYPLMRKLKKEMPTCSPKISLGKLNLALNDVSLKKFLELIKKKITIFDELRDVMRIVAPEGEEGLNDGGDLAIKTIEAGVKKFRESEIIIELAKADVRFKNMVKQIDKYWDKLFSDPIGVKIGTETVMIQPQRTNNMLEQFFRKIKSGSRKKSGTSSFSKTLKAMIANTPLIKNLRIPEYVEIILNGKNDLAERFSEIDIASVRAAFQKEDEAARKYPKGMAKIFKIADLPNKIGISVLKKTNSS